MPRRSLRAKEVVMKVLPARHLGHTAVSQSKSVYSANELRLMEEKFKKKQIPRPLHLHLEHRTEANKKFRNDRVDMLGEITNIYYNETDGWLWANAKLNDEISDDIGEKILDGDLTGVSVSYELSYDDKRLLEISLVEKPDFKDAKIKVLHSSSNAPSFIWPLQNGIYPKELLNRSMSTEQQDTQPSQQKSWEIDQQEDQEDQEDTPSSSSNDLNEANIDKDALISQLIEQNNKYEARFKEIETANLEKRKSNAVQAFNLLYPNAKMPESRKQAIIDRFTKDEQEMKDALQILKHQKKISQSSSSSSSSSSSLVPPTMSSGPGTSLIDLYKKVQGASNVPQRMTRVVQHSAPSGSSRSNTKRSQRVDAGEEEDERAHASDPLIKTPSGFTLGFTQSGKTIVEAPCVKEHSAHKRTRTSGSHGDIIDFAYSTGDLNKIKQAYFHASREQLSAHLKSPNEQWRRDAQDKMKILEKASRTPMGRYLMTGVGEALINLPDDLSNGAAGIKSYDEVDMSLLPYEEREWARHKLSTSDRLNLASFDPNITRHNMLKMA